MNDTVEIIIESSKTIGISNTGVDVDIFARSGNRIQHRKVITERLRRFGTTEPLIVMIEEGFQDLQLRWACSWYETKSIFWEIHF